MADTVTARVEHSWPGQIGPMVCHRSEEKDCASVSAWETAGWVGFAGEETGAGAVVGMKGMLWMGKAVKVEGMARGEVGQVPGWALAAAEWTGLASERRVRVKSCFGATRPARPRQAGRAGGERERERGGGSRGGVQSHRGALGDGRGEGEGERGGDGGGGGGDSGDGEGGGDAAARRFCPRRLAPVAAGERAHATCMRARRPRSPACSRHAARA